MGVFPSRLLMPIIPTKLAMQRFYCYLTGVTCIFEQNFVHVRARVLEQLVVRVEDDDGDLTVAEDGQLIGLLHQAKFALCKGNLERRLNV